ncbi:MAG: HIT domain-containing protein [Bdellovibrionota bacterium]|nr:HIT domain-containing protein [Bdellovibrionota bacterium]
MDFQLHQDFKGLPKLLETDNSIFLMQNKSPFYWVIQIPKAENVKDIYELEMGHYQKVMEEAYMLQGALTIEYKADKLNFAALGNMTPQLHLHHVVRFEEDECWPKPIWGNFKEIEYSVEEQFQRQSKLQSLLHRIFA